MRVNRPFPKELLKKMFLKVLYQNGEINSFSSNQDPNFISILCKILSEEFNVSELSEQEFNEIIRAVNELEADELIEPVNIYGSAKVKMLTKKGRNFVQSTLLSFKLPVFEINSFITRPELREECLTDYLNGDYEIALLKAFRTVEEMTSKAKDPTSVQVNKNCLSNSYITAEGKYEVGSDVSHAEPDSFQRVVSGAMSWFREPCRGKAYDSQSAAQVLLFINIHLNFIDKKLVTF